MKKIFVLFISLILNLPLLAIATVPEGIETNGGDGMAAEFLAAFDETLALLGDAYLTDDQNKMIDVLTEKRALVTISTVAELFLDGVEKDAINHPTLVPPKIVLSRKSWSRLSPTQKRHLSLHEMLPIAGIADSDYKVSSLLVNKIHLIARSNLEISRAFFVCDEQVLNTLGRMDFQRVRDEPLVHNAAISLCYKGLQLLVAAHWNFNQCDEEQTPLELLEFFRKDHLRSRGEAAYEAFRNLLLSMGAVRGCQVSP